MSIDIGFALAISGTIISLYGIYLNNQLHARKLV